MSVAYATHTPAVVDCKPGRNPRLSNFEEQAMEYQQELLGSAIKMTRNPRDAEDLVQDTYLKAFKFFDRFEDGTNCRAWLYRIMTNTYINQYRRRVKLNEILGEENAPTVEVRAHGQCSRERNRTPEATVADAQISKQLRDAIAELPEIFRYVVVLADVQDLSYKAIADICDCPVGTVMSRLYRGRRMLRDQLEDLARMRGIIRDEPSPAKSNNIDTKKADDKKETSKKSRRARRQTSQTSNVRAAA